MSALWPHLADAAFAMPKLRSTTAMTTRLVIVVEEAAIADLREQLLENEP